MGKLINRYALFDAIKNITYNRQDADTLFEEVLEIIAEQPTTTEAEIRASAIDEFAEKLGILCENSAMALDRYNGRPLYNKDGKWHDLINDVAEQLKEE